MSLIRQIWTLLMGMVLLSFVGSLIVWMVSARGYLQTQLALKNSDNAQVLALTLSQQQGDRSLMELVLSSQFDTGYYRVIRLRGNDGAVLIERAAPAHAGSKAPQWFTQLVPIESPPGVAQVSDGWRAVGTLEVISHSSFASTQLWQGTLQTALWLLGSGVLAGLLGTLGVRRLQRPLQATIEQARALEERRFIVVPEPSQPELARLTRAMNTVVQRLKSVFDEQSAQVEALRVQAHCDALTGLSHRKHFLAQLGAILAREDGDGSGLLLLARVTRLNELNRELGHSRTDRLIQAVGAGLTEVQRQADGEVAGRLNGGDFTLCLPARGALREHAERLSGRLRQACSDVSEQADVAVAGVRWQRGMSVHAVLASADEALARAEARGVFGVEVFEDSVLDRPKHGEDEWRRLISQAVAERRARLAQFPVLDRKGRQIHIESPLLLQIDPRDGFDPASLWLPLALRTGLIAAADELAVTLALQHIAEDREPRSVNLSPVSLDDSTYVPRLRAQLAAAPASAALLWLEVAESAAVERFELVRELCKQLRPFGVQVGLEHAGERLARIGNLVELGLDFVKLDASVVDGVADDQARVIHIRSMTSMLHGLGLKVYAEGVARTADMQALWDCGVDGVTGPSVNGSGAPG